MSPHEWMAVFRVFVIFGCGIAVGVMTMSGRR